MALAGVFPWIPAIRPLTVALCFFSLALQALREYECPSFITPFIQVNFEARAAKLGLQDQKNPCPSVTPSSQ